jgi:hypothetical protein
MPLARLKMKRAGVLGRADQSEVRIEPARRNREAIGRPPRKSMRYPVEAQVYFSWSDAEGKHCYGEGTSRDISETGTFVLASICPPLGVSVELRISFIALPNPARILHMNAGGEVLRVEPTTSGDGLTGFAVSTSRAILLEDDDSADGVVSNGRDAM